MSIEKLQEKIRKCKNPTVLDMCACMRHIPEEICQREADSVKAGGIYCRELMSIFKGTIPALRFSYTYFSLLDNGGRELLLVLMQEAKKLGYYVLLDGIDTSTVMSAEVSVRLMTDLPCDGVILSAYAGTDVLEPFVQQLKETGRSVFVILRSPNRSAAQVQDLMTGSRLVHMALAEIANRLGTGTVGRSGYAQVGGVAAANAADSLRSLRSQFKNLFLLVDGYDCSNANAKNCSYAFDKLGHGAVVCAGETITAPEKGVQEEYLDAAVRAAERMRKNLCRYVTIL